MFYHVITFGCQMNIHESEKIAGVLEELGYSLSEDRSMADIIVFNTCAIREGAQDRAMGNIGALKQLKADNPSKIIAVCGCMSQQKSVAEYIYKTFPFIDIILGTHNMHLLKQFIIQRQENNKRIIDYMESSEITENLPAIRTSGDNAWVNIMYGCNNFCTYCIVPYVRGREKSRAKAEILKEVKEIVECGNFKTITLLGQNVNSYGHDTNECTFAELLTDVCKISKDIKITFMTSHPKDLTDEVIEVIKNNNNMLKEVHLPVQSGSDKILKLMNRKYTVSHYLNLVQKLRVAVPNVKISSDFIVGFPGETEQDFNDTLDLVKKVKFNNIFAYMYSVREGTVAASMTGHIDHAIKNKRVNILLNLQKNIIKKTKEEK